MRKILYAAALLCCLPAMGQQIRLDNPKCDAVSQVRLLRDREKKSPHEEIRLVAKVSERYDAEAMRAKGVVTGAQAGDIVTLRLPLAELGAVDACPHILQYTVSHPVVPAMDRTRYDTRTDSVHLGAGLPMPYTGDGVIIGITDWGFDYTHPNYNAGSDNSRILQAWDQFKLSGPAPEGFDYGTVYTSSTQIKRAKCDTAGLYGYGTHGTHVAGIAAGRGVDNKYAGQAPDAALLFASFKLDLASWMDAVGWMKGVADRQGKRLVVNNSWGMYTLGPVDGTSLASQAINNWSDSGIVFVVSAGNCGNDYFHISKTFTAPGDTLRSRAAYYGANENGQNIAFWGEPGKDFDLSFAMVGSSDSVCFRWANTAAGPFLLDSTLSLNGDSVAFSLTVERANPHNGRPHALLHVGKKAGYSIDVAVTASEGTVHAWNLASLDNNAGNMGAEFSRGNSVFYTKGDNRYGIGEPACAERCIAVAAHVADRPTANGMEAGFSSMGPVIDGRRKPDLSAPGVNVASSINYYADGVYTAVMTYTYGTRQYTWAKMSGTSMSCPAVSGIVALMLQADPSLSVDEIKQYLCATARNDEHTGPLHLRDSISDRWGWGKADALAAINEVNAHVDISRAGNDWFAKSLMLFPNPAAHSVTVLTGRNTAETVTIYDMNGSTVKRLQVNMQATVDISDLPHGVYVVRCGARSAKLVH